MTTEDNPPYLHIPTHSMGPFTPTQPLGRALRRLALTTKQAGKDYYKGTGSGAMGTHTKWGGYKIDYSKVRTYKVPDLADFPVCPVFLLLLNDNQAQSLINTLLITAYTLCRKEH